jgi:cobalt/nickel transport system permease protein
MLGAFVFASQMINFPVGTGTTGHLLGAALLAISVGPAAAIVVMTAVLMIQALIFQDGGILALGANVLNMAVVGTGAAWIPYRILGSGRFRGAGVFLAGFCSVVAAGASTLVTLILSGVRIPAALAGVSMGLFGVNAFVEGLVTVVVVGLLGRMNPQWAPVPPRVSYRALAGLGVAAVILATGGVMLASAAPDGLEKLAERIGLAERARVLLATPFADYEASFLAHPWLSQAVAGMTGLALTFGALSVVARVLVRRKGG